MKNLIIILALLVSFSVFAGDKNSYLKRLFTTPSGFQLNYRILYPRDYDLQKQYPLILLLHGAGERGSDNEAQLVHGGDMLASYENQTKYPAIIIAPQCPAEGYWVNHTRPTETEKRSFPYNEQITPQLKAVKELLDTLIQDGKVNKNQVHVVGLSMGGMGTFDLVCRYPNTFATATPICGGINPQRLVQFKGKTIFRIYHGEADDVVDVRFSRDAYNALKKARANVIYKEYPGVNHGSWINAFAEPDFVSWMFSDQP